MRIDNSFLFGSTAGEIRGNQETGAALRTSDTNQGTPTAATLHVPSPELAKLRQLVEASPDTRPDVMAKAAQLLTSGYYNSPEAAQQTADAIVKAID
jgi:hypothetical protein